MPAAAAARRASSASGAGEVACSEHPGTTIVSASRSAAKPCGAMSVKASLVTSGVAAQTMIRYGRRPSASRARPNTSIGVAMSAATTWSRARTATVCIRTR